MVVVRKFPRNSDTSCHSKRDLGSTKFNIQWRWNYDPFSHIIMVQWKTTPKWKETSIGGTIFLWTMMMGGRVIHASFEKLWPLWTFFPNICCSVLKEACCEYFPRDRYVWIYDICMYGVYIYLHLVNLYDTSRGKKKHRPIRVSFRGFVTNDKSCRVEGCELPGGHADFSTQKTSQKITWKKSSTWNIQPDSVHHIQKLSGFPQRKKRPLNKPRFTIFLEARNPWIWVFG